MDSLVNESKYTLEIARIVGVRRAYRRKAAHRVTMTA
jgi:hypothetical protein